MLHSLANAEQRGSLRSSARALTEVSLHESVCKHTDRKYCSCSLRLQLQLETRTSRPDVVHVLIVSNRRAQDATVLHWQINAQQRDSALSNADTEPVRTREVACE